MWNFGIEVLTKTISHNLRSAHFFQISLHPTVQAGWNTIIWYRIYGCLLFTFSIWYSNRIYSVVSASTVTGSVTLYWDSVQRTNFRDSVQCAFDELSGWLWLWQKQLFGFKLVYFPSKIQFFGFFPFEFATFKLELCGRLRVWKIPVPEPTQKRLKGNFKNIALVIIRNQLSFGNIFDLLIFVQSVLLLSGVHMRISPQDRNYIRIYFSIRIRGLQ